MCTAGDTNINGENLHQTYSGFRSRGNITWHITPDMMAYYTFSQGLRPGAFNRTVSAVAPGPDGAQFEKPHGYAPDSLTNNEIGWGSGSWNRARQTSSPCLTGNIPSRVQPAGDLPVG